MVHYAATCCHSCIYSLMYTAAVEPGDRDARVPIRSAADGIAEPMADPYSGAGDLDILQFSLQDIADISSYRTSLAKFDLRKEQHRRLVRHSVREVSE